MRMCPHRTVRNQLFEIIVEFLRAPHSAQAADDSHAVVFADFGGVFVEVGGFAEVEKGLGFIEAGKEEKTAAGVVGCV